MSYNNKTAATTHYVIVVAAVFFVVYAWMRHFQLKMNMDNPLIPQQLGRLWLHPAIVFTVTGCVIVLFQLIGLRYHRLSLAMRIIGLAVIILLYYFMDVIALDYINTVWPVN